MVGLLIVLPGRSSMILVKAASVCWTRGLEYGLRLVIVQPGEAALLERYVTRQSATLPLRDIRRVDHEASSTHCWRMMV